MLRKLESATEGNLVAFCGNVRGLLAFNPEDHIRVPRVNFYSEQLSYRIYDLSKTKIRRRPRITRCIEIGWSVIARGSADMLGRSYEVSVQHCRCPHKAE